MDPKLIEAMQKMTPDEAQEAIANMSPEEKAQMQRMQQGMHDLGYMVTALKPKEDAPNAEVTDLQILKALAGAPRMKMLDIGIQQMTEASIDGAADLDERMTKISAALVEAGAYAADALDDLEPSVRRNTQLLYLHMYQGKLELGEQPDAIDKLRSAANQNATDLLIKSQMLFPQQRWVQPTLAVARVSALVSTALWSHTEEASLEKMRAILQEDELPFPKLTLEASCKPRAANTDGEAVIAGQPVVTTIRLFRGHAADASDVANVPKCNNPQGIYEAYWVYLEGVKPEGTPNSLIIAKPMVCQDLTMKSVETEIQFTAPPAPGKYDLRVHIASTSVVGLPTLIQDVSFTVEEDDVPDLE